MWKKIFGSADAYKEIPGRDDPLFAPIEWEKLPRHVAVIMDGNGRWAKGQGMLRTAGHSAGVKTLKNILKTAIGLKLDALTVYAFSTENWKRSAEEVGVLMNLFRRYLKRCERNAEKRQMRVKIIGDPSGLAPDIQDMIRELEGMSAGYDRMFFQIALNYGGRDELRRAAEKMTADARDGKLLPEQMTEEVFSSYLDTAGIPDPDLLIRTSGEQRLSNFLLWQLAYSEFYFTDVPWPAFDEKELLKAIDAYNNRDRRYGDAKA